ncbi:hypothetical protein BO71DRAFT_42017 [Aspergillus ellipticus CBS 707.79]|uniref:Uncharacterized protein n=1 Tax=Aspergillus ellipticus CBS 707.79 TaxID=1448320 RepID=A0A319DPP8_9EURO|nr:hypothetical protein BO71DRAFT_42017 [Aspergillus ellipticus CBS 707.79]
MEGGGGRKKEGIGKARDSEGDRELLVRSQSVRVWGWDGMGWMRQGSNGKEGREKERDGGKRARLKDGARGLSSTGVRGEIRAQEKEGPSDWSDWSERLEGLEGRQSDGERLRERASVREKERGTTDTSFTLTVAPRSKYLLLLPRSSGGCVLSFPFF